MMTRSTDQTTNTPCSLCWNVWPDQSQALEACRHEIKGKQEIQTNERRAAASISQGQAAALSEKFDQRADASTGLATHIKLHLANFDLPSLFQTIFPSDSDSHKHFPPILAFGASVAWFALHLSCQEVACSLWATRRVCLLLWPSLTES